MELHLHACPLERRARNLFHHQFKIPPRSLLVSQRTAKRHDNNSKPIRKRCAAPGALRSEQKLLERADAKEEASDVVDIAADGTRVVPKGDRQRGILLLNLLVSLVGTKRWQSLARHIEVADEHCF
jgi:hypothetical protein